LYGQRFLNVIFFSDPFDFGDCHGRRYDYHLPCQGKSHYCLYNAVMLTHFISDPLFLHVFFVSYRTFTTPNEVFERLWGRYLLTST
jgi:hypothetical protein